MIYALLGPLAIAVHSRQQQVGRIRGVESKQTYKERETQNIQHPRDRTAGGRPRPRSESEVHGEAVRSPGRRKTGRRYERERAERRVQRSSGA